MPRRLLYVVPTVAALVAGFALVGPGKARGIDAVRVYAAPDADGRARSIRVVGAHREDQRDTPLVGEIRVSESDREGGRGLRREDDPDAAGPWLAELGSTGVAEIKLPKATPNTFEVSWKNEVVASFGSSEGSSETLVAAAKAFGKHEGVLRVTPRSKRGPLVPPFGDIVTTDVTDADGKPVEASLDIQFDGATCSTCAKHPKPAATVEDTVMPIADQVEVEIHAKAADGRTGSFIGKMPTAMGSLWLAPLDGSTLHIVAASPKSWAFVSLFDDRGRIGGRVVPLIERADGFFEGTVDEAPDEMATRYAILSSDENEGGRTVTAWSLRGESADAEPKALPRLAKIGDGFPAAARAEGERLRHVHFILAAFVVALAFIEIALLGILARATRRDLTQHFEKTFDAPDAPHAKGAVLPVRSTLVVVGVVALLVAISSAALIALNVVAK